VRQSIDRIDAGGNGSEGAHGASRGIPIQPEGGASAGVLALPGQAPDDDAVAVCAGTGSPSIALLEESIILNLVTPQMGANAVLRLRALRDANVIALDASGLDITGVQKAGLMPFKGEPLAFALAGGRLCIDKQARAGDEIRLEVDYTIDPASERPAPKRSGDGLWAGYSAAWWMPTLQDPSQRTDLVLTIAVPSDWTVAAHGEASVSGIANKVDPPPGALTVWQFHLDPAPPFLFGFAAGRFEEETLEVDGVTLRALGPDKARLQRALAVTAGSLRTFQRKLGVPFTKAAVRSPAAKGDSGVAAPARVEALAEAQPTYTQVFVEGDAAQEAAGLAFLSTGYLDDLDKDPTEDWSFSHELAHQWFGWRAPCADFADFWLNEGFATFMVAVAKEEKWGRAQYERELSLWRARSEKVHAAGKETPLSLSGPGGPFEPAGPGEPPRRGPREAELQPRGITYSRGALFLDHLRRALGEEAFWRGVQLYLRDIPAAGVRSTDLKAALEKASGKDLTGIFRERVWAPFWQW
jgi:aminopeptidase N